VNRNPSPWSRILAWGEEPRFPWVMGALLLLLSLSRQPADMLNPGFWGEAGPSAFAPAYNDGFLATFFDTISGYQHLALRTTAGLALLVPLSLAPLVFKVAALLIQCLPALYLVARPLPGMGGGWPLRSIMAAIYLLAPNSHEVYLNVVNSQWHLTVAACLILLTGLHRRHPWRALDLFVLALFALSGPYSIICAPLALYLAWERRRKGGADDGTRAMLGIVLGGAMIQVVCLLFSNRLGVASGLSYLTAADAARIVSIHIVLRTFLDNTLSLPQIASLPPVAHLAAVALLLGIVAAVLLRARKAYLLVLLYLAGATLLAMTLLPPYDLRSLLVDLKFDVRYFFFASLFILSSLAVLAAHPGRLRYPAILLLAVACAFALRNGFSPVRRLDTHYADQAAVFETLPPGSSYFFQTNPMGWGMTLVRKDAPDGAPPLATFRELGERTFSLVIAKTLETTMAGEPTVAIEGMAMDILSGRPSGGVFVDIGGLLYPAVTGVGIPNAEQLFGSPELEFAGFRRNIPLRDIGSGVHMFRLIVLDHDRTGRFLPSGEHYLVLGDDAEVPDIP
jgi:hypothetical protein